MAKRCVQSVSRKDKTTMREDAPSAEESVEDDRRPRTPGTDGERL